MGDTKRMSNIYPNLNQDEPVLVLPGDHVRLTMIEHGTYGVIGTIASDLIVRHYPVDDLVTIQIERFTVKLDASIYVLHTELEKFVIGGSIEHNEQVQLGPVPGTSYRFILQLIGHVPDSYLTDLVCVLMNTVNHRATFQPDPTDSVSFSEMDTGDKIGYIIGKGASGISTGVRWTGEQASTIMKSQSEKYVNTAQPNAQPTNVSDRTQKAVKYASIGTKYLAKGTGAEVAKRNSTAESGGTESKHRHIWIQMGKVIKSSVAAYGIIWSALEDTAKLTARTA